MELNIGVIKGDGIGPEIVEESLTGRGNVTDLPAAIHSF